MHSLFTLTELIYARPNWQQYKRNMGYAILNSVVDFLFYFFDKTRTSKSVLKEPSSLKLKHVLVINPSTIACSLRPLTELKTSGFKDVS